MNVLGRCLVVLAMVFSLGACSTLRFSYNNADGLLRYMAWDYFDVDSDQAESLQQRFARLRDWHRSSELPAYVALLRTAGEKASKGLSSADVEWATAEIRSHYRVLLARAAQDAAPVLVTLKPEQIGALERKLAKEDARYVEEWLSGEENARQGKRVQRMLLRFEEWTGDLSTGQRSRIEKFVSSHSREYEMRLDERRRLQREVVALLRRHKIASELALSLTRLYSQPELGRSEKNTLAMRSWDLDYSVLVVDLYASLSAEQRARFFRRMERYEDDFRALAKK